MSRCKKCEGKGFIESRFGAGASWTASLQQCPNRCDIGAYSREVQLRLNNPAHVTQNAVLAAKPLEQRLRLVSCDA